MTCETTRLRLLGCERPDRPPADVQPHLAACCDCRAWQRRLTKIERMLPDVPAPASDPPSALVQQLLHGPPPLPAESAAGASSSLPPWWVQGAPTGQTNGTPSWWVNSRDAERQPPMIATGKSSPDASRSAHPDRARRKVALAFALTLGLAVFSLGWGLWPHSAPQTPSVPETPYAVRESRLDHLLSKARTRKERVRVVDDFADDLRREALVMVRTGEIEELKAVSALYVHLVRDRLPNYVRSLPPEERRMVVEEVAQRLSRTESEMQFILTTRHVSPDVAAPLGDIAVAAREGSDRLWALLREV